MQQKRLLQCLRIVRPAAAVPGAVALGVKSFVVPVGPAASAPGRERHPPWAVEAPTLMAHVHQLDVKSTFSCLICSRAEFWHGRPTCPRAAIIRVVSNLGGGAGRSRGCGRRRKRCWQWRRGSRGRPPATRSRRGSPGAPSAAEVQAKILQTAKDSVARQMAAAPSLFGPSAARSPASGKEAYRCASHTGLFV